MIAEDYDDTEYITLLFKFFSFWIVIIKQV